ncbi:MAG TPA: hypothetical protein VGB73_21170 [Pyrinomonadaceae bacterium]|jgi:hypothetical protein
MQIDVRIALDRLRIVRQNESSDEPFLWIVFLRVDGDTVNIFTPDNSHVEIHAPSGAHHNLGKPSEGVRTGEWIPIPAEIGVWRTTLHSFEGALELTRYASLALVVAGLEEDQTNDTHAVELHRRVIADMRDRLNRELRRILREVMEARASGGEMPEPGEVQERLEAQVNTARVREIIDDFVSGRTPGVVLSSIFNPFSAIDNLVQGTDPDDRVGFSVPNPFTFPRILARSLTGIDIDLTLTRRQTFGDMMPGVPLPPEVANRPVGSAEGEYRVTGRVQRRDIREPPTLAAVWRGEGRLGVYARSIGGRVYMHHTSNRGQSWKGMNKSVGNASLSSGVAGASSADGKRIYLFGRASDHRMLVCLPEKDSEPGTEWRPLMERKFMSGAGAACSAKGDRLCLAATGEDGLVYITRNLTSGKDWTDKWDALSDVRFLASPAVASSADGQKLHILALDENRRIRHAFSPDGGRNWTQRFTRQLDETFISAPACATSADGSILWVAALGDDQHYRLRRLTDFGNKTGADWTRFGRGGNFVSAPALACSPDAKEIHIFGINDNLTLRHRYAPDADKDWNDWTDVAGGAWY